MSGLLHAHSGLRWIVLILLIWSIVTAFQAWKCKTTCSDKDFKIHKFTFISLHIQLLVGLVLYVMNMGGKVNFSLMKEAFNRFFTVEHSSLMIIAILVASVGYIKSKKITETPAKFKMIFITYLIALILILVAIPWPFGPWAAYGGGWG